MTTTAPPDNVTMAFRFAHSLWPDDAKPTSQGTLIAWAPILAPFSIDELYVALTECAKSGGRMPALSALLDVLHAGRREFFEPPRLAPGKAVITGPDTEYRAKLRKDAITYWRNYQGHISQEKLAEIDAWVDEVGPFEQTFLASHGIVVEMSQPVRKGGGL